MRINMLFRMALVGVTAVSLSATSSTTQAATWLPEGDLAEAVANYILNPDAVAGANDWSCRLTARHPNPVILLPGTYANIGANFVKLAPRLKNHGYCVFAMNYGMISISLGRIGGLDHITTSAEQLDAFAAQVQKATGATKVDLVGHSQGGTVPIWWMKKMGGAAKVAHYVGWAPSSHGTTSTGPVELASYFPGLVDQQAGSIFLKNLWADGDNVPTGPKYTVISTRNDTVVTPYASQALTGLSVTNIILQDKCLRDKVGHVGLFNDEPTMELTLNALADGPDEFQPNCWGFGANF
ncbi:esterase/lipase family protein [Streptomyces sp. NPDC055085]